MLTIVRFFRKIINSSNKEGKIMKIVTIDFVAYRSVQVEVRDEARNTHDLSSEELNKANETLEEDLDEVLPEWELAKGVWF
jgi:hypothetical protein